MPDSPGPGRKLFATVEASSSSESAAAQEEEKGSESSYEEEEVYEEYTESGEEGSYEEYEEYEEVTASEGDEDRDASTDRSSDKGEDVYGAPERDDAAFRDKDDDDAAAPARGSLTIRGRRAVSYTHLTLPTKA